MSNNFTEYASKMNARKLMTCVRVTQKSPTMWLYTFECRSRQGEPVMSVPRSVAEIMALPSDSVDRLTFLLTSGDVWQVGDVEHFKVKAGR